MRSARSWFVVILALLATPMTSEALRTFRRAGKVATALVVLAVSVAAVLPGSAMARGRRHRRKPHVAWTLPRTGSAGQAIAFSWSGRHLGKNHKLVVQKPEGTAHTWRSIMRLHGNGGTAQLPGVPLGHYRFRIADLVPAPQPRRRGHRGSRPPLRVMAKDVSGVAVFGEVPFSKLFNSAEQTHATSKYTFSYVSFSEYPGLVFTVEHNQCSYAHIAFVGNGGRNVDGREVEVGTVTATLVQESREPTISSAPEEAIGSLDAELVPGQSWAVRLEAPSLEPVFYVNGYAICDSEEPFS